MGLAALITTAALFPGEARGQPAQTFEDLQRLVSSGQVVMVTDDTGRAVKGRVTNVTGSALVLRVKDEDRVFTPNTTTQVVRRDSLDNGIVFGLVGGGVLGWSVMRAECGPPGYDGECAAAVGVVTIPLGIGVGIAAGALIDGAIHKTLYRSSQRSRVSVVPVVGTDRRGVQLSLSF